MSVAGRVSSQMLKVSREVTVAGPVGVGRAALAAKVIHLRELEKVVPSRSLKGVGQKGAALGVRYTVQGSIHPTALIGALGPWHLVENKSKPHEITPRGKGKKKALATPFGVFARVQHPGVQSPKQPWHKGALLAAPVVMKTVGNSYIDAFKRGLR